jgi:predicted nucleic acid-binding Zn ribbon protein
MTILKMQSEIFTAHSYCLICRNTFEYQTVANHFEMFCSYECNEAYHSPVQA